MNNKEFNEMISKRATSLFIELYVLLKKKQINYSDQPLIKQLIKSSSSVSANWVSAITSRSKKEFFSKMCIVVEECNETIHWLGIMTSIGIFDKEEIIKIENQFRELLAIFVSIKTKLRSH